MRKQEAIENNESMWRNIDLIVDRDSSALSDFSKRSIRRSLPPLIFPGSGYDGQVANVGYESFDGGERI
jgi:hypothetical protein